MDTHSIDEAYEAGRKVGIDEERAATLRWLHAIADSYGEAASLVEWAAETLERGDHAKASNSHQTATNGGDHE